MLKWNRGLGLEVGLIKAGLAAGSLSSSINFAGQYAGTRDLGKVDYASVGISFAGGFIRNPLANTLTTGLTDAAVDYTPADGLKVAGYNKSNTAFFGDVLFNVGLGAINNGIKKDFPKANFMTTSNDFMIQYANTKAAEMIPQ